MSANSDTATPWPPETRRRRHLSAVGLAKAEAADMREAGIGSTDWFDGSLFNTEVTEGYGEHGGRDNLAGALQRWSADQRFHF